VTSDQPPVNRDQRQEIRSQLLAILVLCITINLSRFIDDSRLNAPEAHKPASLIFCENPDEICCAFHWASIERDKSIGLMKIGFTQISIS
jgi:hypothetical protein